jgi:hypothetical protein
VTPNLSRSCGLSSPSSGFIVPTRTKRDGVAHAHPLPLDVVHAHRGNVEEEVHEMVREQVHLVHIQDAPVRSREEARLERLPPLRERLLDVQSTRQPVRARPDRQLHEPHGPLSAGAPSGCGPAGHSGSGLSGSQEYGQPATTRIGGNSPASALTAVDLAVPFSPRTRTPPTSGETAFTRRASFRSSWPTMAENG